MSDTLLFEPNTLRGKSLADFFSALTEEWYPHFYSVLNNMDDCIRNLRNDYDLDLVDGSLKKVYTEFDEMYRKEKLVLFPYLLKIQQEGKKAESCAPFNNTKQHFTSAVKYLDSALNGLSNIYINELNRPCVEGMQHSLDNFSSQLKDIQFIKDCHYYAKFKDCNGCKDLA